MEDFIVEFLGDRDAQKKMLYELAIRAEVSDSSYSLYQKEHGFVHRGYDGVKKWCRVFDLPCLWRKGFGDDHDKCLQNLKTLGKNDCLHNVEVFDDITMTAPYVIITGFKKKGVQKLAAEVVDIVRSHQSNCNCRPKW